MKLALSIIPLKQTDHLASHIITRKNVLQNLAISISHLGTIEKSVPRFIEAKEYINIALSENNKNDKPLDYASLIAILASINHGIGQHDNSIKNLEEAHAQYIQSIDIYEQKNIHALAAHEMNNLCATLSDIGKMTEKVNYLNDALLYCNSALKWRTKEKYPFNYALTKNNIGDVYTNIGWITKNMSSFELALSSFNEAMEILKTSSYYREIMETNIQDVNKKMSLLRDSP